MAVKDSNVPESTQSWKKLELDIKEVLTVSTENNGIFKSSKKSENSKSTVRGEVNAVDRSLPGGRGVGESTQLHGHVWIGQMLVLVFIR